VLQGRLTNDDLHLSVSTRRPSQSANSSQYALYTCHVLAGLAQVTRVGHSYSSCLVV